MKRVKKAIISLIRSRPVLTLASRAGLLTRLYYALVWPAFGREETATLRGILSYRNEVVDRGGNRYLLRRNIHRLEKGILMRPRKEVFGLSYIAETLRCYREFTEEPGRLTTDESRWVYDVLESYFDIVGSHPIVDEAEEEFSTLPPPAQHRARRLVPHPRSSGPSPVTYNALLDLSHRRRSVRWYRAKPVPRALIDKAITVAALSPSACNRQPFEFLVFDEPEAVRAVTDLILGADGFSHNVPVIVALVGSLRAYFDERDRHLIYIDASIAAMSFMYALETLGLGSCPLNWPDMRRTESKMTRLLDLESHERVIMLIALGYPDPDGLVAQSQKKPLSQLRRYNPL